MTRRLIVPAVSVSTPAPEPERNMTEPQTGAELAALARVEELEGLLLLEREAHAETLAQLQRCAAKFGFSFPG